MPAPPGRRTRPDVGCSRPAASLSNVVLPQPLRPGGAGRDGAQAAGFVFQSPVLLDWLCALDNVLLPVSLRRRPTSDDQRAATALLMQLGLLPAHAGRYPRQLSGGQQSRVALARALLLQPPLLLLDEPFAALDAITREDLQQDLLRVCRQHGTTVLFVTHDLGEAVFLGDRVSVIADGRLVCTLTTGLPRPRTAGVRDAAEFGRCCARVRQALGRQEATA
ncbi:MAG: ABC transporter ATP-binding protein [Comamonadaceae bacterium]|nr:MAG: ABC transporter ATP-binding protein [Comamonadaceae bacterium]